MSWKHNSTDSESKVEYRTQEVDRAYHLEGITNKGLNLLENPQVRCHISHGHSHQTLNPSVLLSTWSGHVNLKTHEPDLVAHEVQ